MLKTLRRVSLASASALAVTAAALLSAPAAQAADHKVSDGYVHQNQYAKVGGHKAVLKLDAATKSGFLINKQYRGYAATKYKVTLLGAKKHVLLKQIVGGYQAEAALTELLTHKSFSSDAAIKKSVKKNLARSTASAKKLYLSVSSKVAFEFSTAPALPFIVDAVEEKIKANPAATTFAEVLDEGVKLSETENGITSTLSGTPQAWQYKISDAVSGLSYAYDSTTGKYTKGGKWVNYYVSTKF